MAIFATFSELRAISAAKISESRSYVQAHHHSRVQHDTFLSHSTKDDDLVPAVILILENHGAKVYVDDLDLLLPSPPSKQTADILKGHIRSTRRLVVFVTPNSKGSRWIPWELGLGDGLKTALSVAIFPSAETAHDQSWADQEYLGLYRRIVYGDIEGYSNPIWMVLDHIDNRATPLRDWLKV